MLQQTEPLTLLDLVDRIKERSNDTLLSTISANGGSAVIHSIAPLETAGHGDVAFLADSKYRDAAKACQATALVLTEADKTALWGEQDPDRIVVVTRNPYAWFALALQVMFPQVKKEPGIDPRAVIEDGAVIDPSARVESGAVIRSGAKIGADCVIGANSVIGENVEIGEHTLIYPNVTIYYGCTIGRRNIIHSGAVLGADGFGFAPLDRRYVKIPQIGAVQTGDDVEIGANTCIDRGALMNTTIGDGTKIDDLVMIGHNCKVGNNVVLSGRTGLAGSTTIGDNVQAGGGSGFAGHLSVAAGSIIGGGAGVPGTIDKPDYYAGYIPAMPHKEFYNILSVIKRLPEIRRQLKRLTAQVEALSEQSSAAPGADKEQS